MRELLQQKWKLDKEQLTADRWLKNKHMEDHLEHLNVQKQWE